MSVFRSLDVQPTLWELTGEPSEDASRLSGFLSRKEVDILVTLDLSTLEQTAQAASDAQAAYLEIFGIGSTGKVASFIEQDVILATVAQNDFAIGYLGVKAAVDALEKRPVPKSTVVEHRAINRENMYQLDNQRLLFPFIR